MTDTAPMASASTPEAAAHHTSGPLDDARAQLASAIEHLDLDAGTHAMLATPRREMTVSIPLRRDDGTSQVLIGHRVQHNFSRGPAKGGLRFSPRSIWTRSAPWRCG